MKQALEHYIAQLLYRYDLVTVPDLGTFVTRRRPAYYAEEKSTFFPPSKAITFNPRLTSDDGTLVDAVARGEKINRQTARQEVLQFVDAWLDELDKTGRLYLNGLGTLAREQGKLLFTPLAETNFLPEAYGLHPVVRAKRTPEIEIPEARPEPRAEQAAPAPTPTPAKKPTQTGYKPFVLDFNPPAQRTGFSVRPWMGVAAALLVGGFFAWHFWRNGTMTRPAQVQQAGYTLHESFPPVHLHPQKPTSNADPSATAKPFARPVSDQADQPVYWLIAGAFRSQQNALRLVHRLQTRFPHARLAGTNAKGLHLVAIDAASEPGKALALKAELKARGMHVWIWHRP